MVNPTAARTTIAERLPLRATWIVAGTTLVYDFSRAQRPLAPLPPEAVSEPDEGWKAARAGLLIFGEYDYAEGGGAKPWLGIRQEDGAVFELDGEREEQTSFLNSSLEQFIATFEALHPFLSAGEALPPAIETTLRDLDSQYSASQWQGLVSFLQATE